MAIEIEKKYRLTFEQSELIYNRLEERDAHFAGEDFEVNTIYGGGILDEKNAVLRIRQIDSETILTFKQSIQNDFAAKHRIEHETIVESRAEIEKIVESLGFIKTLVYEKRRKTWKFKQVEIVLDELPFGLFMEIEGSVAAIEEAERLLGANNFSIEQDTYPNLTQKHGTPNGNLIEAKFV